MLVANLIIAFPFYGIENSCKISINTGFVVVILDIILMINKNFGKKALV